MTPVKSLVLAILLSVLAVPAFAEIKGQAAPDFKFENSVTSTPEHLTLEDCKAEVVLIKLWGVR